MCGGIIFYQYHLPPVRRIPPLLWTRIRNDLPNYLSEREADGVSVLSWYHRQFRDAANERYFKDEGMSIYFHSSIADYFLGIWGGGNPKPFQYTEIQKHRFGLKDKNAAADRKVPLQPLVYVGKDGKISRYNLRKFGELPYHLVRSMRFKDLYDNVLFNYKWLHAKISSCPLQSCLSDFEDACAHVEDRESSREIMLVADALRLGGAILMNHPQMLAPQLIGRLLPEIGGNPNVKRLLEQCDNEGIEHQALIPSYHCLHTPGGPLKYSLEGHQFAVFGFCLTADYRYVISISNKFITWDLSTSDLCRDVTPGIEGILQGLCISPDNRYAAAYSNINQIILLNMLTNEYSIFEHPFVAKRTGICGLSLLNMHLVVYCGKGAVVYNSITGEIDNNLDDIVADKEMQILRMTFYTLDEFDVIYWTGNLDDIGMRLVRWSKGGVRSDELEFQGALVIHAINQDKLYACVENNVIEIRFNPEEGKWVKKRIYEGCDKLIQLTISQDDKFAIGTFMFGYKAWNLESGKMSILLLPDNGIRNISTKPLESNSCVMSRDNIYAIAGVRKNLYIWDMSNGELLKNLDAHFGRIIKIQSLTIGNWNSVITSSIDRTVKVWNINNIFEQVHTIDRHELQIDGISISPERNIAATATRNCVGIWDLRTGRMIDKLADSPLGAIVTQAVITKNGKYVATAESGNILIWKFPDPILDPPDSPTLVIFKEAQDSIKQLFFIEKDTILIAVSKIVVAGAEMRSLVKGRKVTLETEEEDRLLYEFDYPIKNLRNLTPTSDGSLLVGPGFEKLKDTMFIFNAKTGLLMHKVVLKYPNFKDYTTILAVPKRATQIAFIDSDKGNIIDVKTKRFIRSVPKWGGRCTKDGKYGLYAPGRGGLELIELKNGKTIRTFIPKVAEGVFTIITMFNKTDEYVLYYHGGRKTLRVFRTSDAERIAEYRVSAELSSIESTTDGKSVVLGTMDGCLTVLAIADPGNGAVVREYLKSLPSRDPEKTKRLAKRCPPFYFRTAAKLAALAARVKRGSIGRGSLAGDSTSGIEDGGISIISSVASSFVETTEEGVTISSDGTETIKSDGGESSSGSTKTLKGK